MDLKKVFVRKNSRLKCLREVVQYYVLTLKKQVGRYVSYALATYISFFSHEFTQENNLDKISVEVIVKMLPTIQWLLNYLFIFCFSLMLQASYDVICREMREVIYRCT